MENVKEQTYEKIVVTAKHRTEFEEFCDRNGIPFSMPTIADDDYSYWIRTGMDFDDAAIMAHKKLWTGEDKKDVNFINSLVMKHLFREVCFWYELFLPEREDELILNAFEG